MFSLLLNKETAKSLTSNDAVIHGDVQVTFTAVSLNYTVMTADSPTNYRTSALFSIKLPDDSREYTASFEADVDIKVDQFAQVESAYKAHLQ